MEVLDLSHGIEYAGTALLLACMFFLCSLKPLAILQQGGYENGRMLRWYKKKSNLLFWRYAMLSTMLLLSVLLLGVTFAFAGEEISFRLTLLPVVFFCLLFFIADRKYALKVPVHETERIKRLALTLYFLLAVFLYLFIALFNVAAYYTESLFIGVWRYLPLALVPLLLPFIACLANGLNGLFENAKNRKYIAQAKDKIAQTSAIKIGVTGSFGKTSVKNILARMLEEKYTVFATPASYNTPIGIAKCVNERKEPFDVFIAEMGARRRGDIGELCQTVCPDHAILTGVCGQHLETFGTVENVLEEKAQIIAGTQEGGVIVVGDDEYTATLPVDVNHTVLRVGAEEIKDLSVGTDGSAFTLVCGEEEIGLRTKLLGSFAAKNVALAASMALSLGVSKEEVQRACEKLDYIPHRLEKRESGGVTVLDDSYNANVRGAKEAIATLRLFDGRKLVVTPGIVELGVAEEEENEKFGAELVGLDKILLVGDTQAGAVKKGYLAAGGEESRIGVYLTLDKAKEELEETLETGDTVLFLNDLPDIY